MKQMAQLNGPISCFRDLRPSEQHWVLAIRQLHFGRYEHLKIRNAELVFPCTCVRAVKFGSEDVADRTPPDDFALKRQVVELFEYVRTVDIGEIRCLEVRHGLPFSMEIEHRQEAVGDGRSV